VFAREIRLAPPDNEDKVVQNYFEIYNNSILPPKHFGYNFLVFSEGELEFPGKLGYDDTPNIVGEDN